MASYTITRNLTNVSSNTIKLRVSPDTGYTLPNTVEVLNGTLDSWNPVNGELILSNVTDTTTVNIVATEPQINYFSIKVDYTDPNIGTENERDVYIGLARYIGTDSFSTTAAIFDGTLEYSKDKLTWTALNRTYEEQRIPVTNGETVYFRGTNNTYVGPNEYSSSYKTFRMFSLPNDNFSIDKLTVSGDILTLLNYTNYPTRYNGAAFAEMFNDMKTGTTNNKYCAVTEIDASNLILPDFTNLACYGMMFRNNNTVHMPKLPALEVAHQAYRAMFSGTTNVLNVSALPGTKIYYSGYYSMFNNVTNMDKLPEIAANELGNVSYGYMFTTVSGSDISTSPREGWIPWYLSGSPVTITDPENVTAGDVAQSMFSDSNFTNKVISDITNGGPAVLYVNPNVWTIAKLEDL